MANYQNINEKTYVAKVSLRTEAVEFLHINEFNGGTTMRPELEGVGYDDVQKANRIATHLNSIYETLGLGFYCYVVRTVENNTHVITNIPDEYKTIVNNFFGVTPEEETTEEEPTTPEEPTE